MNKNKSHKEELAIPPTSYKFYLGSKQRYIHISSQFQSGNIELVRQMSQFHYRLSCIDDGVKTKHRVNSKSWFYFRVHGFPKNTRGKFAVSRVQTLMAVYTHYPKSYRPVYRQCLINNQHPQICDWSKWSRIPTQSPLILRQNGQLQCAFDFLFKNENHKVQFALVYPYTYAKNVEYLNTLNQYYCHEQFYFHKEVLVKSPQNRDVHLLTITSYDHPHKDIQNQDIFNELLFPQKCRPKRFKKPVILITARVHPGQAAASYAMEGIIDFLINNQDVRSYLLKKMFVFMIVPMINVDGVYHGNFRMDIFGKNLNRYYVDPCFQKQPAIYAIKQLANNMVKDNRLSFYFDLHAHNAKKGAFIYGNAINDFVQQVESQVFCKLFAMNNSGFEYQFCNFSQKQMNSKDRNQQRTKQGCGRVVMHKIANIIHSYSLECGIISASKYNAIPSTLNQQFKIGEKGLIQQYQQSQSHEPSYFTIQSYKNLGKSMLISILDVFDKNPYNRVYNSQFKSLQFLRRVTAFQVFHQAQRFRMFEKYVYGKVRNINELIRQVLNSKLHYRELYNFYFYNDKELKNLQWPQNIVGLTKPKYTLKLKRFKSLQEPKIEYSQSFINDLKANKEQLQNTTVDMRQTEINYGQMQYGFEQPQQASQLYSSETQHSQEQKVIDERQLNEILGKCSNEDGFEKEMTDNNSQYEKNMINWKLQEINNNKSLGFNNKFYSSQRFIDHFNQKKQQEVSYSNKLIKFHETKNQNQFNQLACFQQNQQFNEKSSKGGSNQSPSVRVRRLLKQQNPAIKKIKQNSQSITNGVFDMIHTNAHMANKNLINNSSFVNGIFNHSHGTKLLSGEIFEDNQYRIFEQIKSEIKQELRKHKQKKKSIASNSKPHTKKQLQMKQKGNRIKSSNVNMLNLNHQIHIVTHKNKSETLHRVPSKSSMNKNQLPALNSHILVISNNSSRGLAIKQ